ncbi:MAG: 2-oxoacid:acceptor oxidoreductase family protein [Bacillota bacterium]
MPASNKKSRKWPDPVQIQLTGSGGQGLILAGIILASAALKDGYHVAQTQAYGPEARGGASRAEVIIGSSPVDYPHVERPDILLALTQEACDKYIPEAQENTVVIVDSLLVPTIPPTKAKVVKLPVILTARRDIGREVVSNIVALGALNSVTELVSWPSLEDAVLERAPAGTADINKKALTTGRDLPARDPR